MSVRTLILSIIVTCLCCGCNNPQLPPLNSDSVILAFGDSLTYGVGTDKNTSYPRLLEKILKIEVVNAGISGETTTGGLKRFKSVLNQHSPDLIILLEGGNDILRNHRTQIIKENLAQMIEISQSSEIPLILVGVPEKKLFSNSAPFYSELAEKYQLVFDGDILASLLRTPSYKSDSIHLNRQGYQQLAERIQQLLEENGAIH